MQGKIACQVSHADFFLIIFLTTQGRNKAQQPEEGAEAGGNIQNILFIKNMYSNLSIQGPDTSSGIANQTVFKMRRLFFFRHKRLL